MIVLVALVIGIVIFLLSGIVTVGENKAIVTKKADHTLRVRKKGVYFLLPILEMRVQKYSLEDQLVKADFDRFIITLKYRIDSPLDYYEAGDDFTAKLSERLNLATKEEVQLIVDEYAKTYGVVIIDLTITLKGGVTDGY